MNLEKIQEVLSNPIYSDEQKEARIIKILAEDKNVLPNVILLIATEREEKREIIDCMNLELSRAHVYIEEFANNPEKKKSTFDKSFVIGNIASFYLKFKGKVTHCFNYFQDPKP